MRECGPCEQWHGVGSRPSQDNSGGSCLSGGAASLPFQNVGQSVASCTHAGARVTD